jgi:aminoglycoside 3-N-acetyltransferase I
MTSGLGYRHVSPDEVGLLREMLAVFSEAFGEPDTYLGAVPDDQYLRALLAKPHFIALAATSGGAVVGALVAYELQKFERVRSEIYIYDLAVAAPHRRRGIGTGLIEELGRIAAARGAYVMFVQADRGDAPAMALYESMGTREDVHHYDIPVKRA